MSASRAPEPLTFVIPALITWRRTAGRPDPRAPRLPKLVGYYTQGAKPNHTRLREYHTWKDHVRAHAPPGLLRVQPVDEESRVRVDVVCHFASRTHSDPENVRKGIVDALFPHGDKWVYGSHDHPRYDPARPRVEVTVTLFQGSALPVQPAQTAPKPRPAAAETHAQARRPAPKKRVTEEAAQPLPPKVKASTPRAGTGGKSGRATSKATPGKATPARQGWWAALSEWVAGLGGKPSQPAGRSPQRQSRRK